MRVVSAIFVATALLIAGCGPTTTREYSTPMTEAGEVLALLHSAAHSSTTLNPGITGGGDISFTPITTKAPETWGLALRCEHNLTFVVQGDKPKHREMFEKYGIPGLRVTIIYREVYDVTRDRDGEVISKELVDFDFLNLDVDDLPDPPVTEE